MDNIKQYRLFFILALAGHLSILGLFSLNYKSSDLLIVKIKQKKTSDIIQASLLDETRIIQKAQEFKQAQDAKKRLQKKQKAKIAQQIKKEKRRLQVAKNKRKKAKIKAKKDQQVARKHLASIKKRAALEKKKKASIKAQRIANEKRLKKQQEKAAKIQKAAKKQKKIAAEKKRVADAEKLKLQKLANENKRIAEAKEAKEAKERAVFQAKEAKIAKQAAVNAAAAIHRKVTQAWNRPTKMTGELSCLITVVLLPTGDVMSVSIEKSSGNAVFDSSAERAVHKASPLPVPKDYAVFEKNFSSFRFNFEPK
jgi:colicin import membrane protein